MKKNYQVYEQQANFIKAISHPTRLMMVDALSKGDMCVCKLQELANFDMSTISKHLSVLKSAGIVSNRKVNNNIIYKLKYPCVLDFISCVKKIQNKQIAEQIKLSKGKE